MHIERVCILKILRATIAHAWGAVNSANGHYPPGSAARGSQKSVDPVFYTRCQKYVPIPHC